jgi:hypothetical protein
VNWDKIVEDLYKAFINDAVNNIGHHDHLDTHEFESITKVTCNIINKAAVKSAPTKSLKPNQS